MLTTVAGSLLRLLLVPGLVLLTLACNGEPTGLVAPPPPLAAVRISIAPTGLSLIAGGSQTLSARAYDAADRAKNLSFEWTSADPAIASVGKTDGMVTAISVGSTTVTAAAGTLRASATVSVVDLNLAGPIAFTRTTWSPTGTVTADVLAVSIADPTTRSIPRPDQFASIAAPAWSTDGRQLAVDVIHAFVEKDHDIDYNSDLYVHDTAAPAGSPWRALTANGLSKAPSWSPDGKRITYLQQPALFSENNDIYIIDAAGGAPVRLTRTEGWYSRPRWSPDGTRVAFSVTVRGGSNSHEIYIMNADGSGLTNVTRGITSGSEPNWSPDGKRLAFVSTRDNAPFYSDVFVADVDGNNVRRLTALGDYSGGPAWSPDGRQIMFSSGAALYVMNADGSSLFRLTSPPLGSSDSDPVWRR